MKYNLRIELPFFKFRILAKSSRLLTKRFKRKIVHHFFTRIFSLNFLFEYHKKFHKFSFIYFRSSSNNLKAVRKIERFVPRVSISVFEKWRPYGVTSTDVSGAWSAFGTIMTPTYSGPSDIGNIYRRVRKILPSLILHALEEKKGKRKKNCNDCFGFLNREVFNFWETNHVTVEFF